VRRPGVLRSCRGEKKMNQGKAYFYTNLMFPSMGARSPGAVLRSWHDSFVLVS
jgi:hypothetical protein